MRKQLLRLLRIAPLALLFAGVAFAQTTGTIIGVVTDASTNKPVAGALVIASSPNLQGEQTAVTDNAGNFRITQLPPGTYKLSVQLEGYNPAERSDISVRLDKTLRANLAVVPSSVQMEEQVVRTGVAPVINVGSAESGTVVTKEFIANIPVGRDYTAAAVVTPTARSDDYGVSFAGAQSPENNYIVDGMNVTDPAFGTSGATLLSNFMQELDVKSGSFMPEYGRATGGIINTVTKSGSNEFHGSVFSNFNPRMWLQPKGDATGRAGEAIQTQLTPNKGAYDLDLGFEIGGPIMKDKLWFYGGFAPVVQKRYYDRFLMANELTTSGARATDADGNFIQNKIAGSDKYYDRTTTTYQFVGKLTYLLNPDHNFTVSAYGAPTNANGYLAAGQGGPNGAESTFLQDQDTGNYDVIGRYAGKFLQRRVLVEGLVGYHHQIEKDNPRTINGVNQETAPSISYRYRNPLSRFESVPAECDGNPNICTVNRYYVGGYDFTRDNTMNRLAGRLAASLLWNTAGAHATKLGADIEQNEYDNRRGYSGGGRYYVYNGARDFLLVRGYGTVGNSAPGAFIEPTVATDPRLVEGAGGGWALTQYIRSKAETRSIALFAQDSWQILDGLTFNYGVRWEAQDMKDKNSPTSPKIDITDNWGPRAQIIFDPTRQGRSKFAANWGRFYEMIPLDMAARAFGTEISPQAIYNCAPGAYTVNAAAADPRTTAGCALSPTGQATTGDQFIGTATGDAAAVSLSGAVAPVDPNLKGMYVDQFGASAEYELFTDLSVGLEYQGRRLGRTIEDMSSNDGITYFIGNPGESKPWDTGYETIPANGLGAVSADPLTGRQVFVPFPKPKRDYDAVVFKVTKNFANNWLAQASYTYSRLKGNYAGLYRPENLQLDPNLTSEYDLPTLMQNKEGLLGGDTPHTFKVYGSYTFNVTQKFNVSTGAAMTAQSGTPVNALGAHPLYLAGEAFLLPRGSVGRTPTIYNFDLRGKAEYTIRAPYAVQVSVDLFNLLNREDALFVDENYTFDTVQPIATNCSSHNSIGKANPIAAVQAACPELQYLKTVDGRPVTVNENYGKKTTSQAPFSMRIGVALTF